MTLFACGLALFLASHLFPAATGARAALVARWGAKAYRIAFSLVSAAALLMIIFGYAYAERGPQLFAPVGAAVAVAPYAMTLVFILFASGHAPSHLRASVRHPMLLGTMIWAGVHLLANGDLRGSMLFGAFLAYAVVDLASVARRGAVASFVPRARADAIAIVAGVVVSLLVMFLHRVLFGPRVVPFGL
jgi:uncharacterized membrane protein